MELVEVFTRGEVEISTQGDFFCNLLGGGKLAVACPVVGVDTSKGQQVGRREKRILIVIFTVGKRKALQEILRSFVGI